MGFLEGESAGGVGGVGALIASRSIRRVGTLVPTKRLRANDMRLQRGGGLGGHPTKTVDGLHRVDVDVMRLLE